MPKGPTPSNRARWLQSSQVARARAGLGTPRSGRAMTRTFPDTARQFRVRSGPGVRGLGRRFAPPSTTCERLTRGRDRFARGCEKRPLGRREQNRARGYHRQPRKEPGLARTQPRPLRLHNLVQPRASWRAQSGAVSRGSRVSGPQAVSGAERSPAADGEPPRRPRNALGPARRRAGMRRSPRRPSRPAPRAAPSPPAPPPRPSGTPPPTHRRHGCGGAGALA